MCGYMHQFAAVKREQEKGGRRGKVANKIDRFAC